MLVNINVAIHKLINAADRLSTLLGFPDWYLAENWADVVQAGLKNESERGTHLSIDELLVPTTWFLIVIRSRWAYLRKIYSFRDLTKQADLQLYGQL